MNYCDKYAMEYEMENEIVMKDILICLNEHHKIKPNIFLDELKQNFFGYVITNIEKLENIQFDATRKYI
jgi:hypothetical protein